MDEETIELLSSTILAMQAQISALQAILITKGIVSEEDMNMMITISRESVAKAYDDNVKGSGK